MFFTHKWKHFKYIITLVVYLPFPSVASPYAIMGSGIEKRTISIDRCNTSKIAIVSLAIKVSTVISIAYIEIVLNIV